jgi:peroxiredoxin
MKLRSLLILGILTVGVTFTPIIGPIMYGGSDTSEKPAASNFTLQGLDGKTHTLAEYKGKIIVLEWTNPGCPFVKRHYNAGTMQSLQKKYAEQDLVWLTICSTNPDHGEYFADDAMRTQYADWKATPTAILTDKDGAVGHAYSAKTTPHMFVIDKNFNVVYQGAIDNNPRGSKPAEENVNYVDKALTSLIAGTPIETATTQPYGCGVKYAQ